MVARAWCTGNSSIAVLLLIVSLCCCCCVNPVEGGRTAVVRSNSSSKKRRKQQHEERGGGRAGRQQRPLFLSIASLHKSSLSDRWKELHVEHHHHHHHHKETNDPAVIVDVTEFRDDDGFLLYLQQYEERERTAVLAQQQTLLASRQQQDRRFVLRTVVGSVLVVGAAIWWTTTGHHHGDLAQSLWTDLQRTTGTAMAVNLAGTLYHQIIRAVGRYRDTNDDQNVGGGITTATSKKNKKKMDNPWIVLFVTSLTRPDLWCYVWDTVLPTTARTMQRMLVAELWNRLFARLFAVAGPVLMATIVGDHYDKNYDDDGNTNDAREEHALITWMEQDRSFFAMAIKRGTKKMFQSVLQKHLHQAVLYVWRYTTDAIQGVVQQLFPPL
jgi:hypothetical protein